MIDKPRAPIVQQIGSQCPPPTSRPCRQFITKAVNLNAKTRDEPIYALKNCLRDARDRGRLVEGTALEPVTRLTRLVGSDSCSIRWCRDKHQRSLSRQNLSLAIGQEGWTS